MDRGLAQFQQPADYVGGGRSRTRLIGKEGYCHIGCTREQLFKLLTRRRRDEDEDEE